MNYFFQRLFRKPKSNYTLQTKFIITTLSCWNTIARIRILNFHQEAHNFFYSIWQWRPWCWRLRILDRFEMKAADQIFRPLYLISSWIGPCTVTKRVSVAVMLPCGIGSGDFSLHSVDGGEYLQVNIAWPYRRIDISLMHNKRLSSRNSDGLVTYHPKFFGLWYPLKQLL